MDQHYLNQDNQDYSSHYLLDSKYHKILHRILLCLFSHSDSEEFRRPVAWKEMGLTNYLQVITQPMDLSTIKRKLNNSLYSYVHEFFGDLILIWQNCRTYNEDESASKYYNLAINMEIKMLHLIKENLPNEFYTEVLTDKMEHLQTMYKTEIQSSDDFNDEVEEMIPTQQKPQNQNNDLQSNSISLSNLQIKSGSESNTNSTANQIHQLNQQPIDNISTYKADPYEKANQFISFEQKKKLASIIQLFNKVQLKYILQQLLKQFNIIKIKEGNMQIYLDEIEEKDFQRIEKLLKNALGVVEE